FTRACNGRVNGRLQLSPNNFGSTGGSPTSCQASSWPIRRRNSLGGLMRNLKGILMFAFALAVAALAPVLTYGQVAGTGTILGAVADQSGAVIVGAEVRITDKATATYQVQPTNQVGRFTFSDVKPGTYDVEVTMKGFRKLVVTGQELIVGGQLTLNLTLEVGTSTQTVEVTS